MKMAQKLSALSFFWRSPGHGTQGVTQVTQIEEAGGVPAIPNDIIELQ